MSHWKTEAKFVLELQQKDMETILCENDSVQKAYANFVRKWGFSKYDIPDLDRAIAMFILPRLAFYITKTDIIPNPLLHIGNDGNILNEDAAFEEWKRILHTICDGLHLYLSKSITQFSAEDHTLWRSAKQYLSAYFEYLWY